eukprot:GDKJ01012130.1.p1 GENE.GDKJ01012130.1~~GDKJ01012130.1.p1  ORF type:complete len:282 (+),score=62.59 GDKJ01012130.1:23-868(+)
MVKYDDSMSMFLPDSDTESDPCPTDIESCDGGGSSTASPFEQSDGKPVFGCLRDPSGHRPRIKSKCRFKTSNGQVVEVGEDCAAPDSPRRPLRRNNRCSSLPSQSQSIENSKQISFEQISQALNGRRNSFSLFAVAGLQEGLDSSPFTSGPSMMFSSFPSSRNYPPTSPPNQALPPQVRNSSSSSISLPANSSPLSSRSMHPFFVLQTTSAAPNSSFASNPPSTTTSTLMNNLGNYSLSHSISFNQSKSSLQQNQQQSNSPSSNAFMNGQTASKAMMMNKM